MLFVFCSPDASVRGQALVDEAAFPNSTMRSPSRSRSRSASSPSSPSQAPSSPERRRHRVVSEARQNDTGVRVGTRVHVGSLATTTSVRELREKFGRFGDILDLWTARTQPCFAFIVFRHREDALKAIRRMDGA